MGGGGEDGTQGQFLSSAPAIFPPRGLSPLKHACLAPLGPSAGLTDAPSLLSGSRDGTSAEGSHLTNPSPFFAGVGHASSQSTGLPYSLGTGWEEWPRGGPCQGRGAMSSESEAVRSPAGSLGGAPLALIHLSTLQGSTVHLCYRLLVRELAEYLEKQRHHQLHP